MNPTLSYRADIDGLRAIAVLIVLTFHLGLFGESAGSVGIDLFFFISGYLIVGTSLQKVSSWRDIGDFYRRRIARILPMACLVGLLCLPVAVLVFGNTLSDELFSAARSADLFFANIHFRLSENYFQAVRVEGNPYLHFWSLSVEEQFYFIVPFLLFFIPRRLWVFIGIGALSFLYAITTPDSSPAFYLLPSRAWEFAAGAVLVSLPRPALVKNAALIAAMGLFLVLAAAFSKMTLQDMVLLRLVPIGGAAILIHAGNQRNFVSDRILAFKPLTWIGRISYSTYILHWPILVFIFNGIRYEFSYFERVLLGLGILLLSYASYRWIEKPAQLTIRKSSFRKTVAYFVALIGAPLVVISGFQLRQEIVHERTQQMDRTRLELLKIPKINDIGENFYEFGKCFLAENENPKTYKIKECLPSPTSANKKVLLWGDSYAAQRVRGLRKALTNQADVYQATAASCTPLFGVTNEPGCKSETLYYWTDVVLKSHPDLVVFVAKWIRDVERFGEKPFEKLFDETLKKFHDAGIKVLLVGQSPTFEKAVPLMMVDSMDAAFPFPEKLWLPGDRHLETNSLLQSIATRNGLPFVNPSKPICRDDGRCLVAIDGRSLYMDYAHMTAFGSDFLAEPLASAILKELEK